VGKNVAMLMPEPHGTNHDLYLANYLATGEARILGSGRETEARRKDGTTFPIRLSVSEVKLQAGRSFVGMLHDITLQKRAEHAIREHALALERSNRELQNFAYVASHDLQEPLRKIQAFGDRLAMRHAASLDEKGLDYLARMRSAAERMRLLISSLLSYSRVESKALPFQEVDLGRVLAEVTSDLESRLTESSGQIEAMGLPTVEADPVQMHQLLQNLIGNGLKFRRPEVPPRVQVRCRIIDHGQPGALPSIDVEHTCVLEIEDNGIGFDDKYLDRIFNIFQRLHSQGEYEGSGIGLAICRKIAERHGGVLEATGRPGEGATFLLRIPVHQPKVPVLSEVAVT